MFVSIAIIGGPLVCTNGTGVASGLQRTSGLAFPYGSVRQVRWLGALACLWLGVGEAVAWTSLWLGIGWALALASLWVGETRH